MDKIFNVIRCGLLALIIFFNGSAWGQVTAAQARQYVAEKNYDKALDIYKTLYGLSPDTVYREYVNALLAAQKYKVAEKVVAEEVRVSPGNPYRLMDMGIVYAAWSKADKAKMFFDSVVYFINGDDILTTGIVKAFTDAGKDDYVLLAYEKAVRLLGHPYLYARPMAALYFKSGATEKAIDVLLFNMPGQGVNLEAAKTVLLELIGTDAEKVLLTQKALIKMINLKADNVFYGEVLTWIYTQKNDWEGALMQIEAIDERNKETGNRIFNFARSAATAKQYETAFRAYDDIIAKGKDMPLYETAKSEKLATALAQLKNNPNYKTEDAAALSAIYDSFFVEFPKQYTKQAAADFALLEATYAGDVPRAIDILQQAINEPDTRRNMMGIFKLQLGDYYLLTGKLWDASLTYSQVDKEFKQDVMGEDARYRNAKLAYYRGDFDWAQRQLSILKSATSELIANDALYLSVLITENIEDSMQTPLQRFAYAGLLLAQNRDKDAETLLDSIATAYPKHPLNDDIIMQHADIAIRHLDYTRALAYLKTVYEKYGKDVLADDAVFKTADIYYNQLHQSDLAKNFYEQLIIDFPGSTYVQVARQKLTEINNPVTP